MRDLIRKVLKEESVPPLMFKFSEGGYLVPCNIKEATVMIHSQEWDKIKGLNESAKDLYEVKKEYLDTLALHNKGSLQKAIENMRQK
jgi:hypothetical protein